jgi:hypothetical protein
MRSEVWICIPESTLASCNKAYVWNYAQNSWGIRDIPNATAGNIGPVVSLPSDTWATSDGTWATDTGTWEIASLSSIKRKLVLASADTKTYLMDDGATYAGTAPSMFVERTGLALGNHDRIKLVKSVRPRIDAPGGTVVNVRIGGALTADATVAWSAPLPYTVGSSIAAWGMTSGRYIGVKLESTSGSQWRCRSMDIEYELAGRV